MEFNVVIDTLTADLVRIDTALRDLDPAALVDTAPNGLRIAGAFEPAVLVTALRDAGCDVSEHDIQRLPSVCCGGCGG